MGNRFLYAGLLFLICASCTGSSYAQDNLRVWRELTTALRNGEMSIERIRPHKDLGDSFKPILLGFLDSVRAQAAPEDWAAIPEVVQIENRTQYIVPWSTRGERVTYCFSFVTEGTRWYFQHLETIFIRLDKIPPLPTSDFPDVSERQKSWAREEIYWSFVVTNFYLPVAKDKGKEHALAMLKDGGGYFVGAKTWVPFAPPRRAFILYLCWEQAKLRGNKVTLVKLEENDAIVRMQTHFLALYSTAAHLKPRISLADYRGIFETIWQDRAVNAGWNLDIRYEGEHDVTFHFTAKR
jgi:hypothetical protein